MGIPDFPASTGPDAPRTATVIIDNYNYGRFLPVAIESVLSQSVQPIQIIVVDDGSTDDSASVIRSYGDRITPVLKPNGGMGSALNAGYALARGDVVFFLDADDAMYPDAVRTVLGSWKPGVVLVHYLMDVVDREGNSLGIFPPPPMELANGDVREQLLATGNFGMTLTSAMAFLRSTLDSIMPLDEKRFTQAADGYLVRAAAMLGPVQAIHQSLSRQCRHGANDSEFGADPKMLLTSLRKKITYKLNEIDTVHKMAERVGLVAKRDLGDDDASYLAFRIFSKCLEPETHPILHDDKLRLLRLFCSARLAQPDSIWRRLADLGWTIPATALPPSLLYHILRLRFNPASRPSWLRVPRVLRHA